MRARAPQNFVIDARPRGPNGPLAGERILGRPLLDHLLDLTEAVGVDVVSVHARLDEHDALRSVVSRFELSRVRFVTGPPPEHSVILRSDRLYDPSRLRRVLSRGKDPESAVIWRLDRPQGLEGAADELVRRQSYQPLGRFWALRPARAIAQWLKPTWVRPNLVTLGSGGLVFASATLVGLGWNSWGSRVFIAVALAMALILDTADGHLARLQGTTSEFGRWLDANLDELGDMALHSAIAWSCFQRDSSPTWLVLGMVYAMGKYLFVFSSHTGEALQADQSASLPTMVARSDRGWIGKVGIALGHADLRWHLWIVLAGLGRLDVALGVYATYFPFRALAGMARKVAHHA